MYGRPVSLNPASRSRLNRHALPRFSEPTLFGRVARVVCEAECLPRKELFESWEFARRVRRRFRGGRVVDLASGHGLVALVMMVLDDSSPLAVAVDPQLPPSATILRSAFEKAWPRLVGRMSLERRSLEEISLGSTDVVVSAHACGALTDRVLARALGVGARVAVLPCCHAESKCDTGGLEGWMDPALAIDATRAAMLRAAGYSVYTHSIPAAITPKNRVLMGEPEEPRAHG